MTSFDDHLDAMRETPYADVDLAEALGVMSSLSRLADLPAPPPSADLSVVLTEGLPPAARRQVASVRTSRSLWTRRGVAALALTAGLSGSLVGTAAAFDRLPAGARDLWSHVVGAVTPSADPPAHPQVTVGRDGDRTSEPGDPTPSRSVATPAVAPNHGESEDDSPRVGDEDRAGPRDEADGGTLTEDRSLSGDEGRDGSADGTGSDRTGSDGTGSDGASTEPGDGGDAGATSSDSSSADDGTSTEQPDAPDQPEPSASLQPE